MAGAQRARAAEAAREGMMGLKDLALVVRDFTEHARGYDGGLFARLAVRHGEFFKGPLDYVGFDGGGGVGSGPAQCHRHGAGAERLGTALVGGALAMAISRWAATRCGPRPTWASRC